MVEQRELVPKGSIPIFFSQLSLVLPSHFALLPLREAQPDTLQVEVINGRRVPGWKYGSLTLGVPIVIGNSVVSRPWWREGVWEALRRSLCRVISNMMILGSTLSF